MHPVGKFKRVLYSVGVDGSFPRSEIVPSPRGLRAWRDATIIGCLSTRTKSGCMCSPILARWAHNSNSNHKENSFGVPVVVAPTKSSGICFTRRWYGSGLKRLPNHVCLGLDELWEFLEDKENVYIKISRYRGTWETKKFRNMKLDEGLLYLLGVRFFPAHNAVKFIVCFEIPTELEIGGDTYNIDGQWPSLMLHGLEKKDRAYFASVPTERRNAAATPRDIRRAVVAPQGVPLSKPNQFRGPGDGGQALLD